MNPDRDHGDTLSRQPVTLEDFGASESTARLLWSTQVPSKSRPNIFYTVRAYADGSYSCDCPGRKYQQKCHHIKGAAMMLECREVFREPKDSKKTIALKEWITGRRQHRNSMISWLDEDFQAHLPEDYKEILQALIDRPGMTRNELSTYLRRQHTSVLGRVAELKLKLELIAEGDNAKGPTGKPRARLYPNHKILVIGE